MAIYWLSTVDPDEKAFFQVDWTDEMDAAGDTITGSPTFVWIDSNGDEQSTLNGMRFSGVAIASGSKKVNVFIDNADPDTNRTAALAGSPYTIRHTITTTNTQTLSRTLGLVVAEDGGDLVVEDGTAKSTADTYGSLAEADLYHLNHGNTDWTGTDSERARRLRRGALELDGMFRPHLKGWKTTSGQALLWPRYDMTDEDGNTISSGTIPTAVKYAQFELARIVTADGEVEYPREVKRVKAGSAEVEFSVAYRSRSVVNRVEELMAPFLVRSGRRVRA